MRWSLIALAAVLVPTVALAKPKLAVAPLDGDKDGAISDVVAEEAAEHGKTTKPERVQKEIDNLDISSMSAKSVKKLRMKLEVDVVIHGKVGKDGSKKHLELVLDGSGKAKSGLEVDFRTTKDLKKALAKKLGRQIEAAASGGADGSDESDDDDDKRASPLRGHNDDDGEARKKSHDDDEDQKKRDDEDRRKRDDEDRRKRDDEDRKKHDDEDRKKRDDEAESRRKKSRDDDDRTSSRDDDDKKSHKRTDDDDDNKKSHKRSASNDDDEDVRKSDDDDEDTGRHHKKHRHHHDESTRHPLAQAAAWLDAGAGFARRTLTYTGTGNMQPPGVGTAAPDAQIEGELYPAAFSTLKGPAAGLGIAGAFDRELALGIAVPKTTIVAPIKSGYYWIGARYRFSFGGSSIAVGASYWRRTYMADRSKLMMPTQLDMPDVDYTAIAPDITGRFGASPKLAVFGSVQVPLMLNSGPIQDNKSYGPSVIRAFDVRSGVQYAFGDHYALQVALSFDQIGLKFAAKKDTMAADRSVSGATDRSLGLAATLGIMY